MAETVVEAQRSLLMMFAIYWKKIKIEIMRNGPRELIACEKAYECALNAETSKNRLEMLLKRSIDLIGDNGHLILMEKNETDPENEMSQIRWRLRGCQKRYDRFCRRKEDDSGRMNWRCWGRAFPRNPRLRKDKRRGVPNSEWKRFNFSIPQKHNRGYWEEFNGKKMIFYDYRNIIILIQGILPEWVLLNRNDAFDLGRLGRRAKAEFELCWIWYWVCMKSMIANRWLGWEAKEAH